MKNRLHPFILLILLTFIFCACHAPSETSATSSAGMTSAYHNGDRPLAQVRTEDISTIQIAINRDSMPPDTPDPVKTITGTEDIRRIMDTLQPLQILQQFTWGDDYTINNIPVGLDGFSIVLNYKDDTVLRFFLYGEASIHIDSDTYAIEGLPQHIMTQLYDSLQTDEVKPATLNTERPTDLFLLDGWRYFTADVQDAGGHRVLQLQRHKSSAMLQVIADQLSEPVNVWTDGKRVVYVGLAEGTEPTTVEQPRLYSVNLDGSDKKMLPPQYGSYLNLCWDENELCYISGYENDPYPRPLYHASADFAETVKAMDIPGPLLTVSAGKVYCLSTDRLSLLQLPDAKKIKTFEHPVQSFTYVSIFKQYELLCDDGKLYAWKP